MTKLEGLLLALGFACAGWAVLIHQATYLIKTIWGF